MRTKVNRNEKQSGPERGIVGGGRGQNLWLVGGISSSRGKQSVG